MQYVGKACILALTLSTTACLKNQTMPSAQLSQPTTTNAVALNEIEKLMLNELPIPLGFHLTAYEPSTPMTYCRYQGKLSLEKIETFLATDAERNGWSFNNLATPHVKTYLITKPSKTAIITLEQKNSSSILHVNLKTKRERP